MSIIETISLFAIMVALAAMPSTGVALVVTRSATLGVANGIAVSIGIVLGDLVFIFLAIAGLSLVAETISSCYGYPDNHIGNCGRCWRCKGHIRVFSSKSRIIGSKVQI